MLKSSKIPDVVRIVKRRVGFISYFAFVTFNNMGKDLHLTYQIPQNDILTPRQVVSASTYSATTLPFNKGLIALIL